MNKLINRFGTDYFFATPVQSVVIYYLVGFYILVIVATLLLYFYLRKKGKKEKPYLGFAKKIIYTEVPTATLGIFFVFARYESLRTFSWRFWEYVIFISFVSVNVWLIFERRKLKPELIRFNSRARKDKWLTKSKKR